MRKPSGMKRLICALAVIILLSGSLACTGGAAESSHAVRILLSNLALEDSLHIGVYGSYAVDDRLTFQRGSELQVRLTSRGMALFYEGMAYYLPGKTLVLRRHQAEAALENGLRLQGGLNLYPGDLRVSAHQGKLQAVLTVPVEEYLMGVVPYEMSDEFPLEALKAQAIAARTYTLRHLRPDQAYDMTDTPNDQVYYGLNPEKKNAVRAVNETKGLVCFYKNALAQCYYTASNGGFTESAYNAWGRENIPYLGVTEDRYDAENPASEVRQARVPKTVSDQSSQLNPALLQMIMRKLQPLMKGMGFSGETGDIRVDAVENIVPHTTRFGGDSGVMRFLRFDLKVSGRRLETAVSDQEVSFTGVPEVVNQSGAQPVLSDFKTLSKTVSVDLEIFPDAESALGLSINRSSNELVRVEQTAEDFRIIFTRYGHGVGLSQRGAEWMAATYGWDYQKILRFYYPGTELRELNTAYALPASIGEAYLTTPGPAPTATPRPTLMPVDHSKAAGKKIVKVTGIPANSSLNLRAEPNLSSDVIMRLYFGQELVVLSRLEDGWLAVETDVIKGFVREEYVSVE